LTSVLHFLARNARFVLVAGLIAGVSLPQVSAFMSGYLREIIAALLFFAALRIGPSQALGSLGELGRPLTGVLIFQILLPLGLAIIFRVTDYSGPLATALILMAAASPISGSPNLTLMTGNDPAPSLRLLIIATALLPLTILPAFLVYPVVGEIGAILAATLRLIVLIAAAAGLAFLLRARWLKHPSRAQLAAIDGLSALLMALAVIGLMAAIAPAFEASSSLLAITMAVAFAVNFGLQIAAYAMLPRLGLSSERAAFAIAAGNRNVMLFLAVLPAATVQPILLFVACYQVPMYLTPLLLGRLYRPDAPGAAMIDRSPDDEG
jgi:arsenite transporter